MGSIGREFRKAKNGTIRCGVALRRLKDKGFDVGKARKLQDELMGELIRLNSDIGKDVA